MLGQAQILDRFGGQQVRHRGSDVGSGIQEGGEEFGSPFLACSTSQAGLPSVTGEEERGWYDARKLSVAMKWFNSGWKGRGNTPAGGGGGLG